MKRIVLITGVTGRLGTALCDKYHDDYVFVGCGRTKKDTNAHHFIQVDINTQAIEVVNETLQKFGRIDVLINNAAIYCMKSLLDMSGDAMAEVFRTNVITPHVLSNVVMDKFWSSRKDRNKIKNRNIINLSSVSATHVFDRQGAYAPSKAALNLLTKYQAEEFAEYNIRVNAIAPTGFPRIITTESVADAVVEMDKSNITGFIRVME